MTGLQIRAVNSPLERRQFLEFPAELYRGDRHWVPPLAHDEQQRVGSAGIRSTHRIVCRRSWPARFADRRADRCDPQCAA